MGAFVLFYYKQVLGLSGTLTGLAIAISIIWDGISDPMVGAWSDKLRTRWGRRHPLMILSVLPLAAGFIALFSPPASVLDSQATLFYWLLGAIIALRTALTVFMVPYLALGAEITNDYHERTRLASVRTNLGWALGVLAVSSALLFIFNDQGETDGRFIIENYQLYGWFNALAVVIFSVICIAGTWHHIPALLQNTPLAGSTGMLRDIIATFRNRNFRYLVYLDTALGGISGIVGMLLMVTYTYFWELDTVQISILFAGPIAVAVGIVTVFSHYFNQRLEKQQVLRLSCAIAAANLLWLTPLKLLDLLPQSDTLVFILVFFNYAIHVAMTILRTISSHAMLADIADEHELATGKRQEGVMFAAAFFAAKFISGFGYLVAGPFLDFIGLEAGVQPGEAPVTVITGLGLIMGPGLSVMMLLPLWMALRLNVSFAGQQQVRQALNERARTP